MHPILENICTAMTIVGFLLTVVASVVSQFQYVASRFPTRMKSYCREEREDWEKRIIWYEEQIAFLPRRPGPQTS